MTLNDPKVTLAEIKVFCSQKIGMKIHTYALLIGPTINDLG